MAGAVSICTAWRRVNTDRCGSRSNDSFVQSVRAPCRRVFRPINSEARAAAASRGSREADAQSPPTMLGRCCVYENVGGLMSLWMKPCCEPGRARPQSNGQTQECRQLHRSSNQRSSGSPPGPRVRARGGPAGCARARGRTAQVDPVRRATIFVLHATKTCVERYVRGPGRPQASRTGPVDRAAVGYGTVRTRILAEPLAHAVRKVLHAAFHVVSKRPPERPSRA